MKLKFATLIALFVISWPAMGQFQVIELAHEVPTAHFVPPVTRNGSITFRSCEECESFTVRMTPQTRFIVNNKDVDLKEFRAAVLSQGRGMDRYLTVLHHLESDTVSSISISI